MLILAMNFFGCALFLEEQLQAHKLFLSLSISLSTERFTD